MMPKVTVNVSDIKCELYSDIESKALQLRKKSTSFQLYFILTFCSKYCRSIMLTLTQSLDTVRVEKSNRDIEIVEIGRRHNRNQSLFKPEWTCESMGAIERTCLEVALNKVELKSDELEKPIFVATYLKGVFEISNKPELPLCVAIFLQSNQLTSSFDFHEFSTWLQIVKNGLTMFEYNNYSKQYQFQHKSQKDFKRHKKSKSEPPLKFPLNYKQKPCIEFCLEAKMYGCEVQLHSKNSSVLMVLNAVTVTHHKHTETEGLMINIESGEIFTDCVFSEFEPKMQLEPRKHTWGRLIGLQQARASTMKRVRPDETDSSGDGLRKGATRFYRHYLSSTINVPLQLLSKH